MADTKPGVGYVPGAKTPIFVLGITLQANEIRYVDLPETKVIYVAEMIQFGTTNGDIEMAIGPMGDFFDLGAGDLIRLSNFGQIKLHNKTASVKALTLIHSWDTAFSFESYPRSL